ncbi:unnamed protein product, partial [Phaeothamnion confervicola]
MAVSGLIGGDPLTQVERVCSFCIEATRAANGLWVCYRLPALGRISVRIGVHAGPCAGGIVGKARPRFSLFGDTINVASRMESLSRENVIQLSAAVADVLLTKPDGALAKGLKLRGEIMVKGKGTMRTYFLTYP